MYKRYTVNVYFSGWITHLFAYFIISRNVSSNLASGDILTIAIGWRIVLLNQKNLSVEKRGLLAQRHKRRQIKITKFMSNVFL